MKKITYFLIFLFALSACKYDENPYSFTREFDSGTYITPDGKVKFISGRKDSLLYSTDKYAVIQENITYVKKSDEGNGVLNDSILIYGHVYSRNPNPEVCGYDSVSKIDLIERLNTNSNYFYNGVSSPEKFITEDDLYSGSVFESSFGLQYEKDYYVRSFVVTGHFEGGTPKYEDIAYNQNELKFKTSTPNDLWVGGGMEDSPASFDEQQYWGATAFAYDGYMFVAQGHSEAGLGDNLTIYRYDPKENKWDNIYYPSYPLTHNNEAPFTNAVSFVIKNVKISNGNYHDCLYIGLGAKGTNLDEGNTEFYRLILDLNNGNNPWENITTGLGKSQFPGIPVEDAVSFSIKGIGYVGLGTIPEGGHVTLVEDFFSYDPNYTMEYPFGRWRPISKFPNNTHPQVRTKAVIFDINNDVYLCSGKDADGIYYNDLWRCKQVNSTKELTWISREAMPSDTLARVDAVGFSLGESGYVGLGKNIDGDALRDFWRYNPFTDSWDRRADFGLRDMDENLGDDVHDWQVYGPARYEAVGVGIKISDNDYRAYVGTGWAGVTGTGFNDFWHYRP